MRFAAVAGVVAVAVVDLFGSDVKIDGQIALAIYSTWLWKSNRSLAFQLSVAVVDVVV